MSLINALANPAAANPNNFLTGLQGMEALRDFQARNALAGIYSQAIDPQTGQLDMAKYNRLVGASPQAAWAAGPAMSQAGNAVGAQGNAAQAQFVAQQQRLQALSGLATPLMLRAQQGGQVTTQDLLGVIGQAKAAGLINDGDAAQYTSLATAPGTNPTDVLRGWYFRNFSAQQQVASLLPTYGVYDPASRGTYNVPPAGILGAPAGRGGGAAGGGGGATGNVPWGTGLTGGQGGGAAAPTTPAGNQRVPVKQEDVPPPAGATPAPTPQVAGAPERTPPPGLPGEKGTPRVVGGGDIGVSGAQAAPAPAAPAPTPAPAAAPARPAPAATSATAIGPPSSLVTAPRGPAGGYLAGPTPGQQQEWTDSTQAATGLRTAYSGSPNRKAALSELEADLSGADQLNTGEGSQWAAKYSNWVNRANAAGWMPNIAPGMTPDQVAKYEGFTKMSEQLREAQAAQIGGSLTNDKFSAALAATPGTALSRLGNLGMIHILQGNEDAINVKNAQWQAYKTQYGVDDSYYRAWETKFNQTAEGDPRIYWLLHMQPGQDRNTYLKDMQASGQLPSLLAHLRAAGAAGTLPYDSIQGNTGSILKALGAAG